MLRNLESAVRLLAYALIALAGVATVLMIVHVLADVFMRTFMGAPLPGTLEIATHYYLVPMTFLPLAVVELEREHIVVEAFTHFLSERTNFLIDQVVRVVCIATLGLLIWRTGIAATDRMAKGEYVSAVYFDLPIWPARWILPISLAAFLLAILYRLIAGTRDDAASAHGQHANEHQQRV